MASLYTPQSNTVPGQQFNNLSTALSKINTMAPQQANVSPQQVAQNQARSMQFNAGETPYLQKTQQQLTQQSGIPGLQNQQADMGKMFQLWQADQGLSQKYANPQLQSGQSPLYGNNLNQNPYTGSPQDILNKVTPQGQGALNPSANTAMMGEVPQGASNIMNILQGAIGGEQGLVGQQTGQAQQNYESSANMLSAIANAFTNAYAGQQLANIGSSGFQRGSQQEAAYQFNAILDQLGPNATANDVNNYLKTHAPQLKAQGIDVNALQQFQKQLAGTGVLGTATGKVAKQQPKRNAAGQWTLPNGSVLSEPFHIMGWTPMPGNDLVDVGSFYAEYKAAGASDQDIMQRLLDKGYSVQ